MDKEKKYRQICKTLGCEPKHLITPMFENEDDSWEDPVLRLTTEEIMFLHENGYLHQE